MAEPSKNLKGVPQPPLWVEYADPSGGLNTKRDVHALDRNMLAVSINGWPAYDNVVAKRPASAYYINATNGATGLGGAGTTIVATRWVVGGLSTTVLLAQNGVKLAFAAVGASSWTDISTSMGAGAKRIHVAQMFDPLSGANQCFICNGVDLPWMWAGPGNTTLTQTSVANGLPVNHGGANGITPRFVTTVGNNSVLVYSGEPTEPTGVYISNAFYPQAFTQSASTATNYPGAYQPYLVGYNDGVNGGSVTGITSLQGNIICLKESAIYRGQFVNVYGTTYGFQWQNVSATRGMVAPESIAGFDTYIVFLSNDGVYYTDGYQIQQISANSTGTGRSACLTRPRSACGAGRGTSFGTTAACPACPAWRRGTRPAACGSTSRSPTSTCSRRRARCTARSRSTRSPQRCRSPARASSTARTTRGCSCGRARRPIKWPSSG
jgi:hypothetical protein